MAEGPGIVARTRSWIVRHLIAGGRWPFTIAQVVGTLGGAFGGWELFVKLTEHSSPDRVAAWYLWVTFTLVTGGAVLYVILLRTVQVELHDRVVTANQLRDELARVNEGHEAEISLERARRDAESIIAHKMAEEVRRRVDNKPIDLNRPLGLLREHLQKALGVADVKLSVKVVCGDTAKRRLKTTHRIGVFDDIRGPLTEECDASTSYVFGLFDFLEERQQQVLVSDTERLDATHTNYKTRARTFGFRSVLAFPLRTPRVSNHELWSTNELMGFLSLDSSNPRAFNHLFGLPDGSNAEDQVLNPVRSLELFYAVADSLATIVMLDEGRIPLDATPSTVNSIAPVRTTEASQ